MFLPPPPSYPLPPVELLLALRPFQPVVIPGALLAEMRALGRHDAEILYDPIGALVTPSVAFFPHRVLLTKEVFDLD